MTVNALYAGSLRNLEPGGEKTGIFKQPIDIAEVTGLGINGDHQADRRYHGGPEKAIHQYALQGYEIIVAEYPQLNGIAVPGSIGENISDPGMSDITVCIGDSYRIGGVLLQVSQPRSPCWKINHKFGVDKLSMFIEQQRICGWYYRVLETGVMRVGDEVELLERPNEGISVAWFIEVSKQHRPNLDALDALIMCEGLSHEKKLKLQNRRNYLANKI